MKAVVIHGQNHQGSTYHVTRQIVDKMTFDEIEEFFLPRDLNNHCLGCCSCIRFGENKCKDYAEVSKIVKAIENADYIFMDSFTSGLAMSGAMKTLLDHLSYLWMVHRPNKTMFKKKAVVVSTAAGGGAKATTKGIKKTLWWMGVPKIYICPFVVGAYNYEMISEKKKAKIEKKTTKLAKKVKKAKVYVSFKTKFIFNLMGAMQKGNEWNKTDKEYWINEGWFNKNKPWK